MFRLTGELATMKGYRTILFNLVMSLAALVTLLTGIETDGHTDTLKEGVDLLLSGGAIVWTIGNIWLRALTDSPVFKRTNRVDRWNSRSSR